MFEVPGTKIPEQVRERIAGEIDTYCRGCFLARNTNDAKKHRERLREPFSSMRRWANVHELTCELEISHLEQACMTCLTQGKRVSELENRFSCGVRSGILFSHK